MPDGAGSRIGCGSDKDPRGKKRRGLPFKQRDDCEEYQIYKNKSVSLDYLGLDEQIMTPVILINKEDYGMEELMKNNVNVIEMAAIQKDVMEGKMDPSYY